MTTPDLSTPRGRAALLRDIMALDKAIDDFLADLRERASWDKSNVDDDGTVALPCGVGVLHRLGEARGQLGRHIPSLVQSKGVRA